MHLTTKSRLKIYISPSVRALISCTVAIRFGAHVTPPGPMVLKEYKAHSGPLSRFASGHLCMLRYLQVFNVDPQKKKLPTYQHLSFESNTKQGVALLIRALDMWLFLGQDLDVSLVIPANCQAHGVWPIMIHKWNSRMMLMHSLCTSPCLIVFIVLLFLYVFISLCFKSLS